MFTISHSVVGLRDASGKVYRRASHVRLTRDGQPFATMTFGGVMAAEAAVAAALAEFRRGHTIGPRTPVRARGGKA